MDAMLKLLSQVVHTMLGNEPLLESILVLPLILKTYRWVLVACLLVAYGVFRVPSVLTASSTGRRSLIGVLMILALYAFLVSIFFAFVWRNERQARLALFAKIFGALILGGLAVAWLMYPFPA